MAAPQAASQGHTLRSRRSTACRRSAKTQIRNLNQQVRADGPESGDKTWMQIHPEQHNHRQQPRPGTRSPVVGPEFAEKERKKDGTEEIGARRCACGDGLNRKQRQNRATRVTPANKVSHDRQTCQRTKPTQASIAKHTIRQVKQHTRKQRIGPRLSG